MQHLRLDHRFLLEEDIFGTPSSTASAFGSNTGSGFGVSGGGGFAAAAAAGGRLHPVLLDGDLGLQLLRHRLVLEDSEELLHQQLNLEASLLSMQLRDEEICSAIRSQSNYLVKQKCHLFFLMMAHAVDSWTWPQAC